MPRARIAFDLPRDPEYVMMTIWVLSVYVDDVNREPLALERIVERTVGRRQKRSSSQPALIAKKGMDAVQCRLIQVVIADRFPRLRRGLDRSAGLVKLLPSSFIFSASAAGRLASLNLRISSALKAIFSRI
jgi:hypothetical protein